MCDQTALFQTRNIEVISCEIIIQVALHQCNRRLAVGRNVIKFVRRTFINTAATFSFLNARHIENISTHLPTKVVDTTD